MSFYPGQPVVCVKEAFGVGYGWETRPKIGAVYTVRDSADVCGVPAIRLCEIVNKPGRYIDDHGTIRDAECWFRAGSFRPVQKRKTDISCFTRLLKPTKVEA